MVYVRADKCIKRMSDIKESKDETKETKEEISEAEANRDARRYILDYLMTNPDTGERMSYEASRMRFG